MSKYNIYKYFNNAVGLLCQSSDLYYGDYMYSEL